MNARAFKLLANILPACGMLPYVLDTNVLVAALRSPAGFSAELLRRTLLGRLRVGVQRAGVHEVRSRFVTAQNIWLRLSCLH